ncbi:MAG: 50S ribosomal protein L23 [Candidatus Nealsonbacteria bacterium]|nr:50S ribosomal protein L23 [Candidatus Nealsonbacteria bacterium]
MAILDIFKKKPFDAAQGKPAKKIEKVPKKEEPIISKTKKVLGQAYRVLRKPHVTEKATDLTSVNQYVFEIFPGVNKNQVKKAVEDAYGVDVVGVRMINIPRKRRRLGRIEGWQGAYKKAVVRIKEGQKIEVLPR